MALDITRTANVLCMSPKTLYNLISRGEIKSSKKVGGKHQFEICDVIDIMRQRQAKTSSNESTYAVSRKG